MDRLGRRDIKRVRDAFHAEVTQRPPTIGVVGTSGTGKSSTINTMFKTSLEISHTRPCTKEFLATSMQLTMQSGVAQSEPISLTVVDAPGLGEDVRLDSEYMRQYQEQLPSCDVILWLLAARNRGMSLDQQYLSQLQSFRQRIVFGINQVDLVHPMDWNQKINLPSKQMENNIAEIIEDRTDRIRAIVGDQAVLVPYSAQYGYNLERLFSCLLDAMPETRRFIFDGLKNFSYRDFVPQHIRHLLPEGGQSDE